MIPPPQLYYCYYRRRRRIRNSPQKVIAPKIRSRVRARAL